MCVCVVEEGGRYAIFLLPRPTRPPLENCANVSQLHLSLEIGMFQFRRRGVLRNVGTLVETVCLRYRWWKRDYVACLFYRTAHHSAHSFLIGVWCLGLLDGGVGCGIGKWGMGNGDCIGILVA